MLTQGIIRRIGRGETTNIWSMNWLPRDDQPRLQHLVPKCTTVGSRVDLPTYSIVGSTEATSLFLSNGCRGNQFHPIDHQVTKTFGPGIMRERVCSPFDWHTGCLSRRRKIVQHGWKRNWGCQTCVRMRRNGQLYGS